VSADDDNVSSNCVTKSAFLPRNGALTDAIIEFCHELSRNAGNATYCHDSRHRLARIDRTPGSDGILLVTMQEGPAYFRLRTHRKNHRRDAGATKLGPGIQASRNVSHCAVNEAAEIETQWKTRPKIASTERSWRFRSNVFSNASRFRKILMRESDTTRWRKFVSVSHAAMACSCTHL